MTSYHHYFRPEFIVETDGTGKVISCSWDWGGSHDNDLADDDGVPADLYVEVCAWVDGNVKRGTLPHNGDWPPPPTPEQVQAALEYLETVTADEYN